MSDGRQLAYLAALGVDVYVRRAPTGATLPPPALATAADAPEVPPMPGTGIEAGLEWEPLRALVSGCTRCSLHQTRTQTVFGVGNPQARWMFIGEAPGADEDRQGEPFVGRAGQLLTSMLQAVGFQREDVYIANVL